MPNFTTLEDASHCPKCGEAGKAGAVINLYDEFNRPTGKKSHLFTCDNERCKWYTTGTDGWQVQVNPDGTVPVMDPNTKNPLGIPAPPIMSQEAWDTLNEIDPDGSIRRGMGW